MELLGRDTEVLRLRSFVDRAFVQGEALLVSGEAGVGKSALLATAAAYATERNALVLRAAGVQFEAAISFAGLHQVLHPLLGTLDVLSSTHSRALSVAVGRSEGEAHDPLVVAHATLSLLIITAQATPVLLLVDDLPWLDRPSSVVLGFVARRLRDSRVGFLAASRADEGSFFERGDLPTVELAPLDDSAAEELLERHFPAMAAPVRRRLRHEAEGNPLALLELPAALTGMQRSAQESMPPVLPLSERLQRLFATRVQRLPDPARRLLLLAALQRTGELHLLERAAGQDGLSGLAPAERAGLVGVNAGRLAFRHPLTRSAVVELSTSEERRRCHQALADQLIDQPEQRAWHLAEATIAPDKNVADLLEEAAHLMLKRGDAIGAVAALTRAADLTTDGHDRGSRLAQAAYLGANVAGGLRNVPGLLAAARAADPGTSQSLATTVAAAHLLLNGDGDLDTAHRLLASAIEMTPRPYDANNDALVEALHTLLLLCFFGGRSELWEPFDAAVEHLAPNPPAMLALLRDTLRDPARTARTALERLDTAIAGLAGETDPVRIVRTATAAAYLDRLGGCREPLGRVVADGRRGGAVTSAIEALFLLGNHAFFTGEWDEVLALSDEGLELCDAHDYRLLSWPGLFEQAMVAACRGNGDTARALSDRMARWAAPRRVGAVQTYVAHVRTLIAFAEGDYQAAYRHAAAVSPPGELAAHVPHALWTVLDLTDAAVRSGHTAEAAKHATVARETGLSTLSPRLQMVTAGAAAMASERDFTPLFEQALATPDATRWPFDHARIQLAWGERLRRARALAEARTQLTSALDTFTRLRAEPWAVRARNELRATGTSTRQLPTGTLSPQQLEIAKLAAAGLTNKQIGARLFLSPRTVGTHLYQLFPKLGITSRAALRDALAALPTAPEEGHIG